MKKFRWILLAVLLVIVVVGVTAGIWIYNRLHSDVIDLDKVDGDIAFISDRDGSWDVFILQADGTLRNLTQNADDTAWDDDYLAYIPFKGDMVYFYTNRTKAFTPARVNVDGTGLETMSWTSMMMKLISSKHLNSDPSWSPDGTQIAWTKTSLSGDICLAPTTDTNNFTCITKSQGNNQEPGWSPDGSQLVFVSDRGDKQDVYVATIASGDQTRLTNDEGWAYKAVWSLDGSQILFIWNLDDDSLTNGWFDYHVVKADGSDLHRLAEGEIFKGDPRYSPSGKQVIYMSNESGHWQLYVMDAGGSNVRQLTEGDSNNLFPVWVPKPAE